MVEFGCALEQKYARVVNLSFNGCQIGDLGFSKIYRYLSNPEFLCRLDLSGCDLSPVAMSMIIESLKTQFMRGQGQFWIENLRKSDLEVDPSKALGIKVLRLNSNPRLSGAIVPLLTAVCYDDLKCLERIELRKCEIESSNKFNATLEDMLDKLPGTLSVLDLRENPILENQTSRNGTIL